MKKRIAKKLTKQNELNKPIPTTKEGYRIPAYAKSSIRMGVLPNFVPLKEGELDIDW